MAGCRDVCSGRRVGRAPGRSPQDRSLVREDHAGFNRALAESIEWHKEYWSTEENALQATGLVALAPLAMACLAYDASFPIEVESEYFPIALLERDWPDEFPT